MVFSCNSLDRQIDSQLVTQTDRIITINFIGFTAIFFYFFVILRIPIKCLPSKVIQCNSYLIPTRPNGKTHKPE